MASEEKSAQEPSGVDAFVGGADGQASAVRGSDEVMGQGDAGSAGAGSASGEDLGERQSSEDDSPQGEDVGIDAVAEGVGAEGEGGGAEGDAAVEVESEPDVLGADEAVEVLPSAAELAEARDQVDRFRDQALRAQAELENARKRMARDVENAHKYALEGFIKSILPVRDSLELGLVAAQQQKNASDGLSGESSPAPQGSVQGQEDAEPISSSAAGSGAESAAELVVEPGLGSYAEGDVSSERSSAVEPDGGESQAVDSAGSSGIDKIVEGMALTLEMLDGAMGKHGIEIIDPKGETFNPEVHQAISEVPSEGVAPKTVIDVFQKGCLLNGRVIRAAMVVIAK